MLFNKTSVAFKLIFGAGWLTCNFRRLSHGFKSIKIACSSCLFTFIWVNFFIIKRLCVWWIKFSINEKKIKFHVKNCSASDAKIPLKMFFLKIWRLKNGKIWIMKYFLEMFTVKLLRNMISNELSFILFHKERFCLRLSFTLSFEKAVRCFCE